MPRKGFGWYQISCLCTDGFFFFFKYSTLTTERSGFIEGWRGHWTCLELFSLYTFLNTFCAPKKAPSVTILVWHGYNVLSFVVEPLDAAHYVYLVSQQDGCFRGQNQILQHCWSLSRLQRSVANTVGASSQCYWDELMLLKCKLMLVKWQINTKWL